MSSGATKWDRIQLIEKEMDSTIHEFESQLEAGRRIGYFGEIDDPLYENFKVKLEKMKSLRSSLTKVEELKISIAENSSGLFGLISQRFRIFVMEIKLEFEISQRVQSSTTMKEELLQFHTTTNGIEAFSSVPSKDVSIELIKKASEDFDDNIGVLHDINNLVSGKRLSKGVFRLAEHFGPNTVIPRGTVQDAYSAVVNEVEIMRERTDFPDMSLFAPLPVLLQLVRGVASQIVKGAMPAAENYHESSRRSQFRAAYLFVHKMSHTVRELVNAQSLKGYYSDLLHIEQMEDQQTMMYSRTADAYESVSRSCHVALQELTLDKVVCEKFIKFLQASSIVFHFQLNEIQESAPVEAALEVASVDENIQLSENIMDLLDATVDSDFVPGSYHGIKEVTLDSKMTLQDLETEFEKIGLRKLTVESNTKRQNLGSGSYDTVLSVNCKGSRRFKVAVKCFRVLPSEGKAIKRLVREASVWYQLKHENILHLYGYCASPGDDSDMISFALAAECHSGNLPDYLDAQVRPEKTKMRLLLEVSKGLEYLHGITDENGILSPIIHGDIRAVNVLVKSSGNAILCDFGLASMPNLNSHLCTKNVHTEDRWRAYETFPKVDLEADVQAVIPHTVKTDIYAFGCVCFEVIHQMAPYSSYPDNAQVVALKLMKKFPVVEISHGYRLREYFQRLMDNCLHIEPEKRPPATTLVKILTEFTEKLP